MPRGSDVAGGTAPRYDVREVRIVPNFRYGPLRRRRDLHGTLRTDGQGVATSYRVSSAAADETVEDKATVAKAGPGSGFSAGRDPTEVTTFTGDLRASLEGGGAPGRCTRIAGERQRRRPASSGGRQIAGLGSVRRKLCRCGRRTSVVVPAMYVHWFAWRSFGNLILYLRCWNERARAELMRRQIDDAMQTRPSC